MKEHLVCHQSSITCMAHFRNSSSDAPACRKQLPLGVMWDSDGAAQRVLHTGNAVRRLVAAAPGPLFIIRLPTLHVPHTQFLFQSHRQTDVMINRSWANKEDQ